jgi:putative ABC transport system permease protein
MPNEGRISTMIITRWWKRFSRRRRTDADAERELAAHLSLEAEEQRQAGLSPREAAFAARRALGNATAIREDIRAVWTSAAWDQLKQDTRYSVRTLVRNPGFSLVALLSLALGIGANTAIFTFVNAAFLEPLPYPDAGRIVALRQRPIEAQAMTPVHPRSFVAWNQRARSFEALAIAQAVPLNTEGTDGAEQVPGLWMSPELFRVFGVRPYLGSGFSATAGAEVILSYGYWQRRFGGDRAIVGRKIPAGSDAAIIVGVMPAGFQVGSLKVDVYSPLHIDPNRPEAVGSRSFLCFGRLRPGATLESARAEMTVLAGQIANEVVSERDFAVVVTTLRDFLVGDNGAILLVLSGVVGLVLLIACANLAGLLLTRGAGRRGELAVRAALGAGRWRIVRQLGVESLVLAWAGGALGLLLGLAASRALAAQAESAVDFGQLADAGLDARVLAFTLALSTLTALLFGLFPAWHASRADLQSSVRTQGRGSRGGERIRSVLVVAEVAVAVVLLVGAGLLLRSFVNLTEVKLGFRPENVVTMRTLVMGTPAARANLTAAILERVETMPGVLAVGTIQFLPLTGITNHGAFHFVGRPRPADPRSMESDVSTVSRGYFAAIGMELLRGRVFGREDQLESPRVALVNQSFVNRYSPGEDPIGRLILGDWMNPKPTQIVGVVNDTRHNGLTNQPRPTVFLAQAQVPGYFTNLVVRTVAEPMDIAAAVRAEMRRIDPRQPFTDVQPMRQYVSMALARPRLHANLLGVFATLALFLAAIGLYGLLAYAVSQRTHEIGIRMALGAQSGDVLAATLWHGLRLVAAGVVLGIAAALGLSELVARFLFDVRPTDPLTYAGVAALLLAVTAAATLVPARRAASIDPIVALRYE